MTCAAMRQRMVCSNLWQVDQFSALHCQHCQPRLPGALVSTMQSRTPSLAEVASRRLTFFAFRARPVLRSGLLDASGGLCQVPASKTKAVTPAGTWSLWLLGASRHMN